ncbi:choline dehydrogenase [Colletotrichum orchidophilum]|uniref:Choline dehydrogenase n=1 Tax=Colletotrichum orchidophilum TaxID=1209926 RepID=A0A1G4AUZ0_9PEZI|nr:choline dehydrogenase [Colletotrichum orchidophilum]OHE92931.1 choline dehydrogenase [Colletotrichum orchidophilum]
MYSSISVELAHNNRSNSANSYLPLAGSNHYVLIESKITKINLKAPLLHLSRQNLPDLISIQSSYELKSNYTGYVCCEGMTSMYEYPGGKCTFINRNQALSDEDEGELLGLAETAIGGTDNPVGKEKLHDGFSGVKGYPTSVNAGHGKDYFTLIAATMHPLSRGNFHANPENPRGPPLINPKYLSNEYDSQAAIQAIKKYRQVALRESLRSTWVSEYEPGLNTTTDAQRRAFALKTTLSIHHPVGSCVMLPKADGRVIDPLFRVYKIENLRVVDASIMPVLILAHIQTTVYCWESR